MGKININQNLLYSASGALDPRFIVDSVDKIENISNAYVGLEVYVVNSENNIVGKYKIKKINNLTKKPLPANEGGYELIREPKDLEYSDGTPFLNNNGYINSDTKLIEISDKIDKLPSGIYYGQYSSVENLPAIGTLDQKGYAYVSSIDSNVYYIYLYNGDGEEWQDSGNKFVTTELETNLSTKSQIKAPTTKAVQEGIEAVDVTLARSAEGENELTATQKYNASANINNRGADVVPVTGEIKALGYKILNPNKSFVSQVTAHNTIYEIRDKFDLGNSNVVSLPNILQKGDELNLSTSIEVLSGEKVTAPTGCKIVNNNKDSYIGNNNVFENTGSNTTVFVEADTESETPTITIVKELEGIKTTSSETTSIDETVYNLTESITLNAGDTLVTSTEGAVIINSNKDSVMTVPLTAVEDNTILYIGFVGVDKVSYTISKTIITSCSLTFTLINVKTYNKSEAIVLSGKANIKVNDDTFIVGSNNMIIAKKTTYRNYSNATKSVFLINENATTTAYITRGTATIPSNCTLKFNGGKIINATINSDDVKIESDKNKIFDNVGFNGYCTKKFYKLEWFVDKYTKKVDTTPPVCAASQIEEALESGVFNLTIGRDRYYPLKRTVEYVGICNFFEETLANVRSLSESRYANYRLPCIYSNDVVTLINYIFKDISSDGRESQSLNLRGLSLLCNKAYSDLSQKDVPLLKITAKTPIWGLTIDAIIKNTDCNIVIDEVDNGHYIEGATVHKMFLPNYTGIKLVTNGGYMTNVTINGDMSGLYRGISVEHGPNVNDWMTAININASTNCAIGADLQGYFAPCIITNQHQTRACFKKNNEVPYFQAGGIDMQGFVYDLNLPQNGVSRAKLAFRVNNDNENNALVSFIKGNQTESAEVSYPIYTGDIGEFIKKNGIDLLGKSTNLLYKSLNSNSSPAITKMSYKVSVGDTQVNVFHQSGETTFYTLTNAVNIFAPNLMAIQHDQISNMILSDNATFTLKDAYKNSTLNFSLSFTINLANLGITESSCILLRFPLTCKNIKIVVNSKEYTLSSSSLYYYKSIYCLPLSIGSTVSITWTYKRSTSNSIQNALFPFIYIPMLSDSKYQFYEGWFFPKGQNNYSRFFFRSTASGTSANAALNRHRFASIIGNGAYDSDGYEYKAKIGSSTSRPTFDNNNENIGYPYFDTTLGKPIYWNGVAWIDANGDYIVDNQGTLQDRLALTSPVKGQQFKLTVDGNNVYLIYGDYGWLKATDRTPWYDDSGTLNAMYDKYNYALLTVEPSNWATKYNTYYKIVDGVYTKLITFETWATDTFYKLDVNTYKGIQVKLTDDTDTELLNKIVKWNGTKYINIVDNVALKAGTPIITFDTENNTTTATITSTSSGKLYYTTNGNNPTASTTEYTGAVTLSDGDQIKAICIRDHVDNSAIEFVKVATPVVSFDNAGILAITCDTADAKIYYTTDGSVPSTASTEYDSSASVTIAKGVTVNAIAVLIGRVNSEKGFKKR